MKSRYLYSIGVCAIAIASQTAAAAQSSPGTETQAGSDVQTEPAAVEEPATKNDAGLEDIVVTAQRRSENLQRAAIAVSSVGGEAIRSASVVNPSQLTAIIPSLQISPLASSFNFYLRGVGNVNGNPLSESAIAFNYGGVYIGRPASSSAFFYDIERMEVLKGPQGTLYGRNATGGAINVIPKAPTYDFGGEFHLEVGNYGTVNAQAAVNVPLSSKAALRVAGFAARHDGYNRDGTDDQDDMGGRIQLLVEPTDDLKINIMADYASIGGNGTGATPIALGIDNRDGIGSPAGQAFYQAQIHVLGGRNFLPIPPISFQDNKFAGISSTIDWRTGIGTFTVIPAYRWSRIDSQTTSPGFVTTELSTTKETSLEARFASDPSRPLKLLLGGYYYDADTSVPLFMVNNQFDYTRQTFTTHNRSAATFGRITYEILPTLRVNTGVRYTHERKTLSGTDLILDRICLGGIGACPNAVGFPFGDRTVPAFTSLPDGTILPQFGADGTIQVGTQFAANRKVSVNRVTWRAGIDWDVGPDSLLYASYETGFKSGGFFFTHDQGVYRPEKIKAWTIGSKNRFLDDRLQLNLEAFWWTYIDQQISHVAVDSANTAVFVTENVGKATIRGVEADLQYLVAPQTLLSADVQFLDAKYDDFVYQFPNFGAPPATTCPFTLGGANYAIDCSGLRPPMSPKWTINLGIEQTFELANTGEVVLNGRMHYQSMTLTSLEFLPEEYQSSYATFDAAITYKSPANRFSIGAFINNITDKTVLGGSFIPPFSINSFSVGILRPPRTYGIRTGFKF